MKKRLAIVIIAALLFLIIGCSKSPDSGCSGIAEQNKKDACIYDLASNGTDQNACSTIGRDTLRNGCMAKTAINSGNLSMCSVISEPKALGYCYAQISMDKKDMEACQQTPESYWRMSCTKTIAIETQQHEYCRRLNEADRDECFALIAIKSMNGDLCQEVLKKQPRDNCLYYIATRSGNLSMCKALEGTLTDYCIRDVARATRNASQCGLISIPDIQKNCISELNTTKTAPPSLQDQERSGKLTV